MNDLKGRRYNFWRVEGEATPRGSRRYWKCLCACGRRKEVLQYALTSGASKSCGCRSGEDLSNQRFDRLTAVSPVIRGDGVKVWLCVCACGKEPLVRARDLKSGATTSCGCVRKDGKRYRISLTEAEALALWDALPKKENLKGFLKTLEAIVRRITRVRSGNS